MLNLHFLSIMKIKFCLFIILLPLGTFCQLHTIDFDTLTRADLELVEIDLINGNNYRFTTHIESDNNIYLMPAMLPKGYFEAYYHKDSNHLAFTYYNFGKKSYSQQFYFDGSMKSDSEYDQYGNMHGMHVIFDRNGEEIWHADYWHGEPELRHTKNYLDVFNYTSELIKSKKAFGCYVFNPTPMRERHDEISLNSDGSFQFHNYKSNCDCNRHSNGKWRLEDGLLKLEAENPKIWPLGKEKTFALISKNGRNPVLVEYSNFGLNWYASEFYKCKKCNCYQK